MDPRFKADGSEFDFNVELPAELERHRALDPLGCQKVLATLRSMDTAPKQAKWVYVNTLQRGTASHSYASLLVYYQ